MAKNDIDTEYFTQLLRHSGRSYADLGKFMGIDRAAAHRTIHGGRRMKVEEATKIASFLRVPVADVLAHAGVSYDLDGRAAPILLVAMINDQGIVTRLPTPRRLPQNIIDRAEQAVEQSGSERVIAAQVRATTGALAFLDDAIVLFRATESVDPAAQKVLAICRDHGGAQVLAKLESARKTGEAKLTMISGKTEEFELETATPVLAILP